MKRKIFTAILGIVFLAGASILLYPSISNWVNQKSQSQAAAVYLGEVEEMDEKDYSKEKEQADQYNQYLRKEYQSLSEANIVETKSRELKYDNILNIGENEIIGVLEIPAIKVYLPIYHGTEDNVLQVGIGHYIGSSLPIGGESTHAVLTGHRGLPSAKLLTDIDQLVEKDFFYIHVLDETLAYEVDNIETVLPSELDSMDITENKDYVTLVTCTPYGINTHRLLVRGKRIPFTNQAQAVIGEVENNERQENALWILAFLIPIICFYIMRVVYRKQKLPELKHQMNGKGKFYK
ncbi:class C sortase [Scatolibacter rhodanostii]|uniref:class C sortase n=1 Tax=Scatolibacter rhodanostii TaxID=2014781 RepID=UPI000C068797|nr:class C sortase [Scatolibacter rhodanostii]